MTIEQEPALDDVLLKPLVENALTEDLGRRGDVTSQATIPADMQAQLQIKARQAGVICGIDLARLSFALVDAQIEFIAQVQDGETVEAGAVLATVKGNARHLLTAERTALNFMTHLSGIATATRQIVDSVAQYPAQITCTRKTIPGLRIVQKYAVRCGGGRNHRLGLDDAILIKDNHIAIAGDIKTAIQQAQRFAGHLIPIEVEVDTLEQLEQALDAGVSLVLLDNMSPETLSQAVAMCKGRAKTEASGGITPETVQAAASTGVDFIAMGYLTHSTTALDIGLDFSA
ncbi:MULTISPECIES: carboxylating nicotinate-nucleotide diphosphorylase [unclassified Psychrobacter]|jgi:nicotinate-nucleotide pyrophosphorylase (carboxylating)|uniref:carboxylating nicotinate-nucleotide diphosphorylase n=1 Tax=unclassified Psychrobacter TaxID=196806 RepID=UPI000868883A|nr:MULTISPECIES: carboxylating nicotinate-nucleotide diphosphorylase [unclassified Psychrobacter]MBA6245101.1 carboxylating nicotinate-nucleotide diphosphorylase [Psychrobacter sp. Urea-trap-18]MBA6286704.1 carboxylating nicotinate-nucleotide diphosphorylase [Psychrobacter sp. Urea-trap-16]MBA6317837.1 carboxylating nicotinate-nucleotide diphosphorylase [Psychrobacter sp. Urea-trap-20]MBA6334428.1 carboxylating nicotinate-nucleotide diphosphorylase [Psychrobacter sp. Urea-trap-19]OEH68447.1 MA|tara:strand:+ start:42672 stop:43532 length:861 start_codon:yes stop_codon:yes gene_type:complete